MKIALILYEMQQLSSLDALVAKRGAGDEKSTVVSLDAEIDYALEKRSVPFISGKTLQNREDPASYLRADEIAQEICESKALAFLQYRSISLLKPLRFSIHIYFINLLHYIDLIARLVEKEKDIERLVVPAPSTPVSKTSSFLAEYGVFVVADAVRFVAESRGISFEMVQGASLSIRAGNKLEKYLFTGKRVLFGMSLSVLNAFIALRPRRVVRILASDYWRNIAPTLEKLPESELILLDRSEALRAGFAAIWRHKVRFVHVEHFLSRRARKEALQFSQECLQNWLSVQAEVYRGVDMTFRGVPLALLCERIMSHLVKRAVPRIACEIAGTYAMYENLSPDAVLLRASVSEQIHFIILPLVAREVGIPALEVQHGGEYLGPGSATRQHAAYYLAEYGRLVCDEFRALGYANERLISAGSPRFDSYMKDRKDKVVSSASGISILSNTPSGNVGERYGTYSVEEYFHALGEAVRAVPDSHLAVASRSSTVRAPFLKEARERGLHGMPYESVGATPLPELFTKADIFVCSHSTVVYEALLYRLPVVVASFAPVEKMMTDFHFAHFREAGVLAIAHTPEELRERVGKLAADAGAREKMAAAAEAFMKEQFSFDGHAAERIARLVLDWSKRERP